MKSNESFVPHQKGIENTAKSNGPSAVAFFKIPKTAGKSLRLDCPFFSICQETCLVHTTSFGSEDASAHATIGVLHSPRAHVLSQFVHCRFDPWKRKVLFPNVVKANDNNVVKELDTWLMHMTDPKTQFRTLEDSFTCYTPWNLQSCMLACDVRCPFKKGAQIICDECDFGETQKPPTEPVWEDVQSSLRSLDFAGLTKCCLEMVCVIKWIKNGTMPKECDCAQGKELWVHDKTHGVPNKLHFDELPSGVISKIDTCELARTDQKAYPLAEKLFMEKPHAVETESGMKLLCDKKKQGQKGQQLHKGCSTTIF